MLSSRPPTKPSNSASKFFVVFPVVFSDKAYSARRHPSSMILCSPWNASLDPCTIARAREIRDQTWSCDMAINQTVADLEEERGLKLFLRA